MQARAYLAAATILVCVCAAQAENVNVTVSLDNTTINVAGTTTLHVYGQTASGTAGDGIVSWDVDLTVGNTTVAGLGLPVTLGSSWDHIGGQSSTGTWSSPTLDAIYDLAGSGTERGVGSPVELFSATISGLALGTSTLTIQADYFIGADFTTVVGLNDDAGVYTSASTTLTVVPEPVSVSLLALGAMVLVRRRRK